MSNRRSNFSAVLEKKKAIREENRKKLELLKKERKDAEEATHKGLFVKANERKELDEILHSIGVAPISNVFSNISGANSFTSERNMKHTSDPELPNTSNAAKKRLATLSIVAVQSVNIPPKETVTYTKETQTTATWHERDDKSSLTWSLEWEDEFTVLTYNDDGQGENEEGSLPNFGGFVSKPLSGILPHGFPQVKEVQPAITVLAQEHQPNQGVKEVKKLCDEEKQMIIQSEDFQHFIDRTGRIMERVLCENIKYDTDYSCELAEEDLDEKSDQRISLNRHFVDERWSRNRCVTSMDWSLQFPELLLASYNNNEDSRNDPDGVVLIWNTKFKKTTPEYIFHCQSAVLSAKFAKFHPNLIFGGTYSGQIVLWDNRVHKRTPVQRTPVSASTHTHPVYCMGVMGTKNAHNLISISTDSRLCSWSLDMLSQPQETLDLNHNQPEPLTATCLDFPYSNVNNFVFGSEEGAAYSASRHGAKAGIKDTYEGHQGPVTGISVNAVPGVIDFSHIFLTSSIDWTIKLWTLKNSKPIYSFEDNGDYVLDVKWSPAHPALFAAVDGSGRLDLWNLNDTEVPIASVIVEKKTALNRVSWTPSGLHVTVGDVQGKISVYDIAENLAYPCQDEWNKFFTTIQELSDNQIEEELEKLNFSDCNSPLSRVSSIARAPLR